MSKKQIMPQEDDKNCQVNMRPVKSKVCSDKKCQETKFMQPVKPKINMQSILRPAKLQSSYKRKDQVKFNQASMKDDLKSQSSMCSDKNCHYSNQQLQDCVVTRNVNLQDVPVTRMRIIARTINPITICVLIKSQVKSDGTYFHHVFSNKN